MKHNILWYNWTLLQKCLISGGNYETMSQRWNTHFQNSFGYGGWKSKRENYALTKWVLTLFPRWNVFTLFRFLVSEKEFMTTLNTSILNTGLCGDIITFWFCSFDYQRVFKDLLTNSTFKEMNLSYHVYLWNSEKNHCYES